MTNLTLSDKRAVLDTFFSSKIDRFILYLGKGAKKSCLVFKYHLLQTQEPSIPMSRKSGKNARRLAWMNKELQAKLRCKKEEYRRWNIESGIRDR